jgi:alkylation response protein AidB-like acyl-CoA dehydrogenase
MDFSLNERQRAWQARVRKFAQEAICQISLLCDQMTDPTSAFDWEIIKKGSRLGFRTAVVLKEYGGHGIDFMTQTLVMIELARDDCAIAKACRTQSRYSSVGERCRGCAS